jgi:LacI family transcriptional regulator
VDNNLRQKDVYLDILRKNRVSGILLIGAMLELKDETIKQLVEDNISIIFIGRKIEKPEVSYVSVDNVKGGFLATEHLIKLGHTEIGVIIGLPGSIESEERYQGYRLALEKYGIELDESLVVSRSRETNVYLYGYRKAMNLFQRGKIPSAIFACGDTYAFGAIKAVRERGLRVPEDISIVGFNDTIAAGYYNPPLTTIRQPMAQMGRAGANILINVLENKSDHGKKSLIIEPELIVRESSSSPACKDRGEKE